jgi:hypothetical protein
MKAKVPIQIGFAPRFLKDVKRLLRKYAHIRDDIADLIDLLESGETPVIGCKGVGMSFTKCGLKVVT